MKKTSISFYTLGCRLNQSETAVLQNSFSPDRYKVTDFNTSSDIVVVNTCTVTANGDADTRRIVNKITRRNPKAKIALIGCQAQVQKNRLAELPNVQWVIGNSKKMDLATILSEAGNTDGVRVITPPMARGRFTIPFAGIDRQRTRANIKVQDGCDCFCTFCEVPYARGRARSRAFDDILREARILACAGHKEIVVTGINLGAYRDRGKNIIDVLKALDGIKRLKRVRISSIEPAAIPDELLEMMSPRTSPQTKLCRYLHIPLQNGDDAILKSMKRQCSSGEFLAFIRKACEMVPGICLGTDVIAGFPGETEDSFKTTCDFLKKAPVHYFHVFSYSQRNMAKSKDLPHQVPKKTIQERSRLLRELSRQKRLEYYKSLAGTACEVLFEQKKAGGWEGLTDNYVRVKVKSTCNLKNRFRTVKLKNAGAQGMTGEILK